MIYKFKAHLFAEKRSHAVNYQKQERAFLPKSFATERFATGIKTPFLLTCCCLEAVAFIEKFRCCLAGSD